MSKEIALKNVIAAAECEIENLEQENIRYTDHPANRHKVKRNKNIIAEIKAAIKVLKPEPQGDQFGTIV